MVLLFPLDLLKEEVSTMGLDFHQWMNPVPRTATFSMPGYHVWCGTMSKTEDGVCHLLFSRWPEETGHNGWVTHSEIAYATADHPLGPYSFQGVILRGRGGDYWDANVIHNPTMIRVKDNYYLYYMGNKGNGEYWDHRNRQRIGVAVAEHPSGPWTRFNDPVINVSPESWDHLMVSNPTVTSTPDGKFIMIYKGVGKGSLPKGGAVVCGVAVADTPLGPFRKLAGPIMVNPEDDWSVEDPFIWRQGTTYYALVKDFQGYFTKQGISSVALFESKDGIHWVPSEHSFAFKPEIVWEDGEVQQVNALERPQLWMENDRPAVLFCAVAVDDARNVSFNVHIPLRLV
ncbi:glycoside hydrolase family protein [Paenibacillus sedimenti]|uniref:Glycoside hydrolase family protein n=1 Tax=Paenibacillus sedimenti TaxID=2770274 RepID=A0A926KL99_9BACL|nr:glycoside hydrolase family protein [Paenibacillus sedimenti]MBD0379740.1 glycoside hydrolase family protein [Paenibacillus sedimenti]